MPLMWAHAEYIKLLRSASDGNVYDAIPEVGKRYSAARKWAIAWKYGSLIGMFASMRSGEFCGSTERSHLALRWSSDEWQSQEDSPSKTNALQIDYLDLARVSTCPKETPIRFTFFWLERNRWEGQDYEVLVR